MPDSRIVLIAHAPLASALKACARHVFADRAEQIVVVDVTAEHDVASWHAKAGEWLGDSNAPVLLLTDVFGATPFNIARDWADWCVEQGMEARVLTGANVPMLLRAITYSDEPLAQWVERAESGGVQGIIAVSPNVVPKAGRQQSVRHSYDSDQNHHHQ
ncbi:PTS fructose transporter subunit IIA [Lampropedia puyangensis]|uniref:PTS fructose transporter subunit IIA n=1 Tax=Lampropedia puyangensis TaxID=1330072 RepID=A0A4S8F098_9BURK|nr:PTS fructose transporter subunit IIA [Lampropedia puyangensis]THU00670.1 PTS fructose transporter subunit IIA [Lampropedia puyangensis]